jgi:hypothetical protein
MNRLPALSVARLRIFAGLTIAAAAAISFESIRHLAVIGGFGTLSILFPLTLDAVAAYGMDLWVRRSPAARQAKWLALAAIFGSLIANVVDHWLTQRAVLGAVLGAVPPGMLAALLAVAHKHASGTEDQAVRFDPAVRDAVWSALPQADRHVVPPPDRYLVPDRIVVPVRSGPIEGPAVGPMVRRINVPTYDELDRQLSDRTDVVRSLETKLADRAAPRRTSAARSPRLKPARSASATVRDDTEIVSWIRSQADHVTKKNVMEKFAPIGSGRALRLIAQSKEA